MKTSEIHCYNYVTAPYPAVCAALRREAAAIFQRATSAAAQRAGIATTLSVSVGPFEVGVAVKVDVRGVAEKVDAVGGRTTQIEIAWEAASAPALFPVMEGTLSVYPLGARETQLDLHARYRSPLGPVGMAVEAVVGRKIAEASLHRFVDEVSDRLSGELAAA